MLVTLHKGHELLLTATNKTSLNKDKIISKFVLYVTCKSPIVWSVKKDLGALSSMLEAFIQNVLRNQTYTFPFIILIFYLLESFKFIH